MSGGSYNYAYGRIRDLADSIHGDINKFSTRRPSGYDDEMIEPLPAPCLDAMRFVAGLLEIASEAAHDVEWMMSGDTGDDTLVRDVETAKQRLLALVRGVK